MQLRRRHFPNTVITKNPANQKFYIHFFIDSSNANISLYTLSCPDFNLGQLRLQGVRGQSGFFNWALRERNIQVRLCLKVILKF